jgi:hypothetical protein
MGNFLKTLPDIREGRDVGDVKGKKPVFELKLAQAKKQQKGKSVDWKPRDIGWQCLNVDASFMQNTREASWVL